MIPLQGLGPIEQFLEDNTDLALGTACRGLSGAVERRGIRLGKPKNYVFLGTPKNYAGRSARPVSNRDSTSHDRATNAVERVRRPLELTASESGAQVVPEVASDV